MKNIKQNFIILILIVVCGCTSSKKNDKKYLIKDLKIFPQNASCYINEKNPDQLLINRNYQKQMFKIYLKIHFKPWGIQNKKIYLLKIKKFFISIFSNLKILGYGENRQRYSQKWLLDLIRKENFGIKTPFLIKKGIIISNSNLRALPTEKPYFKDINSPSDGYPFDLLQASSVHYETPVLILNASSCGGWYLVKTPFAVGWVKSENIALLNPQQIKQFRRKNYITIKKDDFSIYYKNKFLAKINIGSILPIYSKNQKYYTIIVPIKSDKSTILGKIKILKKNAIFLPEKCNQKNVAKITNEFVNEKYGWGGIDGYRDCSSSLKDMFSVFGIYLPRNSFYQSKSGIFTSFENLNSKQKEDMILKNAIPFLSLIYLKGHIMLYLGKKNHQAIAFHTFWGIRIKKNGKDGRLVIGKGIITTLKPGKELKNISMILIDKIKGFTNLVPKIRWQEKILNEKITRCQNNIVINSSKFTLKIAKILKNILISKDYNVFLNTSGNGVKKIISGGNNLNKINLIINLNLTKKSQIDVSYPNENSKMNDINQLNSKEAALNISANMPKILKAIISKESISNNSISLSNCPEVFIKIGENFNLNKKYFKIVTAGILKGIDDYIEVVYNSAI